MSPLLLNSLVYPRVCCWTVQATSKDVVVRALEQIKPKIFAEHLRAVQPVIQQDRGGVKATGCNVGQPSPPGEKDDDSSGPSLRSSKQGVAGHDGGSKAGSRGAAAASSSSSTGKVAAS